jgi:ATP-dependent DNA helicase RecQ
LIETPLQVLQRYWGYDSFRPLQEDIIQSVLEGRDTLALMPTGGGKSICFQVPALAQEGICIVVSPLIALMKDQVQQLQARQIPAVAVYSGMNYREIDRLLDNCVYGKVKFLYLSPERLTTELARERIRQMQVNLIAVDEAHCVSQWGYDFRPPYLEIPKIREVVPDAPTLAVTATATPEVVRDIQDKLAFGESQSGKRKTAVFQKSFERDNLTYVVRQTEGKPEKLVEILQKVPGSSVVYARSRKGTKDIAGYLRRYRIPADYYHAGLDMPTRSKKQEEWIRGDTRVMVATNAFGMGIDKSNVRTVVHMELPDSLEAYFQEAGRAGRDGEKAFAVLLYNPQDKSRLQRQFELANPELDEVRRVYRALGSYLQLAVGAGAHQSYDFDLIEFCQRYDLPPVPAFNALSVLEKEGLILITEAVFNPASMKIMLSKDDLYDYQLKHPNLDKVLKVILRSYQGAFSQYIHLREGKLANFLNTSREKLQQALELMHRDKVVDYRPQKEKPQLIFLHDRLDADHLEFDVQRYHFLKNRHLERMQAAIRYAEDPTCRSQQLLLYFGQDNPPVCGQCDVCLTNKKQSLSQDELTRFRKKIGMILQRESLTLEEVLASFSYKQRPQVLETLQFLMEEGIVEEISGKYVLK